MSRITIHPIALAVLACLAVGWAAPEAAPADDFQVEAWAIRATKSNEDVSSELKPILSDLKRAYPQYTGFKLEKRASGKVEAGKTYEGNLANNFIAKITPIKETKGQVQMKVLITQRVGKKEEKKFETTYTVKSGKMQLVSGWAYGSDLLIIGVRAR